MNVCPKCSFRGDQDLCPNDGQRMVPESIPGIAVPDLLGKVFADKYEVQRLIGIGAMSTVWQARHQVTHQKVALKLCRRDPCRPEAEQRFLREARACSRLSHPNTIRVFDFGSSPDGYLFMAMELLRGRDLRSVLKAEGALHILRALRVGEQVCDALDEAHSAGVIHRDLKPSNIFLAEVHRKPDFVKVIDFGISRFEDESAGPGVTSAGMLVGTPRYASPEQAQGEALDARSDLYSFGVVLYEMLTGKVPFDGPSSASILIKHVMEPPPPLPAELSSVPVPEKLRELLDSLLAKKAADRPERASVVSERLREIALSLGSTGSRPALSVVRPGEPAAPDLDSSPSSQPAVAPAAASSPSSQPALAPAVAVATPARRFSLPVVLGALLASAAVVAAIALLLQPLMTSVPEAPEPKATTLESPTPPAPSPAPPAPVVQPAQVPAIAPVPVSPRPDREVTIESVPGGAMVTLEGGLGMGRTPFRVKLPAGKAVVARVRAPGYYPASVKIGKNDTVVQVRLKRTEVEIEIP